MPFSKTWRRLLLFFYRQNVFFFRFVWFWVFQRVTSLGIPRKEFILTEQPSRWKMAIQIIFSYTNYVTINFAKERHIFVPKFKQSSIEYMVLDGHWHHYSLGTEHVQLMLLRWIDFNFNSTKQSQVPFIYHTLYISIYWNGAKSQEIRIESMAIVVFVFEWDDNNGRYESFTLWAN